MLNPKRTKQICKKCTNVAQPGNFGFCEEHRAKKNKAAASDGNAEPVITLVVEGGAPVDTAEPTNDLFPPSSGTVHDPAPSAEQQHHLNQRGEIRIEGIDQVRYNIVPNVPCIGFP